jgi:hypothetical protein
MLRTVGFDGRLGNHSPACYAMLTGKEPVGDAAVLAPPQRTDQPPFGCGRSTHALNRSVAGVYWTSIASSGTTCGYHVCGAGPMRTRLVLNF